MNIPDTIKSLAISLTVCPSCGAGPTEQCVTATGGRVSGQVHNARSKPLWDLYFRASREGYDDALARAVRSPGYWKERVEEYAQSTR